MEGSGPDQDAQPTHTQMQPPQRQEEPLVTSGLSSARLQQGHSPRALGRRDEDEASYVICDRPSASTAVVEPT
eukprot:12910345-Prorocentrum_lima.AAC.1